jgi:hypothetical protein
MPKGSIADPFPTSDYWSKYEGCVAGILTPWAASAVRAGLEQLPVLDRLEPLMRPLLGPFELHSN